MTDPGLPLTTGEGNTARDAAVRERFQMAADSANRAGEAFERDLWLAADKYAAECGRLREREQAAHGEGYDQGVEDVWSAPVCSVCGANHDADESAMCERGEVVSFREWVDAAGRLREQLDAARQALSGVSNAYGCFAGCTGALAGAPADGTGHTPACRAARAALGVEGPAE